MSPQENKEVNFLAQEKQLVILLMLMFLDDVMFVEKAKRFSKAFES